MVDPFIGEIKYFGFDWAPRGWALCNGAPIQISQNSALFSLIGVQFGGDGKTYFNLPDMRGRAPVGTGHNYQTGQAGGQESVTLEFSQASHTHYVYGTSEDSDKGKAANANDTFGVTIQSLYAADSGTNVAMNATTVQAMGGSQPHNNMQPSLVGNACIATVGVYPSRN